MVKSGVHEGSVPGLGSMGDVTREGSAYRVLRGFRVVRARLLVLVSRKRQGSLTDVCSLSKQTRGVPVLDRRKEGLFIYGGWVSLHPAKDRYQSMHQVE